MMANVVLRDRLADWRGKIHVVNSEIAGARIISARLKSRRRQLNKRMMLAHGDRLGIRRYLPQHWTRFFAGEGKRRFDFSVLRKVFRVSEIESAASWIQTEDSLLQTLQRVRNLMRVAQVKGGGVDQRPAAFFGRNFKSPQRRFGKSVFDRAAFVGVVAVRTKAVVRCYQQNAGPGAFEAHDVTLAKLASIQTDIVRTDGGGQRLNIKKLGIPLVDLQPDFAGFGVPVEGNVAGKLFHAGDFFGDGLDFRF